MERVVLTSFADNKLQDLVDILYVNEYFGFRADAKKYVDRIYAFIYSIPRRKKYRTRKNDYGEYYCKYKPNKKTSYFITFDTENELYLIKNIITNHTSEYPTFILEI